MTERRPINLVRIKKMEQLAVRIILALTVLAALGYITTLINTVTS